MIYLRTDQKVTSTPIETMRMTTPSKHPSSPTTGDAQGNLGGKSPTTAMKKEKIIVFSLGPLKISRTRSILTDDRNRNVLKEEENSEPETLFQKYFTCSGGACLGEGGSPPSSKGKKEVDEGDNFLED